MMFGLENIIETSAETLKVKNSTQPHTSLSVSIFIYKTSYNFFCRFSNTFTNKILLVMRTKELYKCDTMKN